MNTIQITVDGNSYVWHRYDEPLEVLNAEDINNISDNIAVIETILKFKGYDIKNLKEINASFSSEIVKIFDILNAIEYNLTVINSPNIMSIYYGDAVLKMPTDYAHNREEIWRWIQILEDMLEIVQGIKPKWGALLCTNGYPTINGKKIIVRGDFIG